MHSLLSCNTKHRSILDQPTQVASLICQTVLQWQKSSHRPSHDITHRCIFNHFKSNVRYYRNCYVTYVQEEMYSKVNYSTQKVLKSPESPRKKRKENNVDSRKRTKSNPIIFPENKSRKERKENSTSSHYNPKRVKEKKIDRCKPRGDKKNHKKNATQSHPVNAGG